MIYQKVGTGLYTCTGITGELEYPDSNWGMQESKSCALPLGDTPSIIFISAVAIFSCILLLFLHFNVIRLYVAREFFVDIGVMSYCHLFRGDVVTSHAQTLIIYCMIHNHNINNKNNVS